MSMGTVEIVLHERPHMVRRVWWLDAPQFGLKKPFTDLAEAMEFAHCLVRNGYTATVREDLSVMGSDLGLSDEQ